MEQNQTLPDQILPADLPSLQITYFTDPLCCWSWAFEPVWQQLQNTLKSESSFRICMGGMLSSWEQYFDELRSITRPAQMGPIWMEAKHLTNAAIDTRLWMEDPPASSYPACVAVKTAALQNEAAAGKYLYQLRKAAMTERRNIAKKEVLLAVAAETAQQCNAFDLQVFTQQLANNQSRDAFRKDLEETKQEGISRFPSLLITAEEQQLKLLLTGFRPWESVIQALTKLSEVPASPIPEQSH